MSTTNTETRTPNEVVSNYSDTNEVISGGISQATEVFNKANADLEAGLKNNDTYKNSGLNTEVAKDANGNPIGTYQWDKQAENTAKITYNSDVLAAKGDAIAGKQELVNAQQQGQVQHDMAQYSANQSAEKAGWTGGYILDTNRQVAFLKESIKASLYSQEELQKYGYDTALAAARANYDLKKTELALDYYKTAVNNAFQMAEYTGYFISPEASYHISQRDTAQKVIDDSSATAEEKARAKEVLDSIDTWFEGNNISSEGVACISVLQQNLLSASNSLKYLSEALVNNSTAWETYQTMMNAAEEVAEEKNKSNSTFSYVDSNGVVQTISGNYNEALTIATEDSLKNWLAAKGITKDKDISAYKAKLDTMVNTQIKNEINASLASIKFPDNVDTATIQNHVNSIIAKYKEMYGYNAQLEVSTFTYTTETGTGTITIGGGTLKNYNISGALEYKQPINSTGSTEGTAGTGDTDIPGEVVVPAQGPPTSDGKIPVALDLKYSDIQYIGQNINKGAYSTSQQNAALDKFVYNNEGRYTVEETGGSFVFTVNGETYGATLKKEYAPAGLAGALYEGGTMGALVTSKIPSRIPKNGIAILPKETGGYNFIYRDSKEKYYHILVTAQSDATLSGPEIEKKFANDIIMATKK